MTQLQPPIRSYGDSKLRAAQGASLDPPSIQGSKESTSWDGWMDASPTHEFPGFLRDSMMIHRTKAYVADFCYIFVPKRGLWFVHLSDFLQYCKRHVVGLIYIYRHSILCI